MNRTTSLCLLFMAASIAAFAEELAQPESPPDRVYMRRFTVSGAGTPHRSFEIEWNYPPELAGAFESAPDLAAKLKLGLTELQRQAAEGDAISRMELGYFHLYGIGLPRDLAEAERLLRSGGGDQSPACLALLAWEYAVEPGQWRRAAELAIESLEGGYEKAAPLAAWLIRNADARRFPELGERLLQALLARSPDHFETVMALAEIRRRQRNYEAVWSLATRALENAEYAAQAEQGDASARRERMRAHLLRVEAATRTGRSSQLIAGDIREIAATLPPGIRAIGLGIGAMAAAGLLALWAWLTRRRGELGPGGWLTAGWIGFSPFLLGVTVYHPVTLAVAALLLASSARWALASPVRRNYFPNRTPRGLRGAAREAAMVLAALVAVLLIGAAYQWLYQRITGRPLEDQFIRGFIRLDTPLHVGLSVVTIALAIPFYEEVVYRGFLTDALGRRLPPAVATLIAATAFGLIHGPRYAVPVGALGLFAGLLRWRGRSLWPAVALHAVFNGIALAAIAWGA